MRAFAFLISLMLFAGFFVGCGDGATDDPSASAPEPEFGEDPAAVPRSAAVVERLLIVGLDGAHWPLIDRVVAEGRAPNFARLIESGVRADLTTLTPTVSPAIWTSLATGVMPEVHGIFGFDGVPGATMTTLPNARMRLRKTYWNILSDFGVSSGTIGWWASWPTDPLAAGSFLISDRVPYTRMEASVGRTGLDADDAWPEELLDMAAPLVERPNDLDPVVVSEWLGLEGDAAQRAVYDAKYEMGAFLPEFKFVYQSDRSTLKVAKQLLQDHPVQVATVYFTGIDTVSHLFWHFTHPEFFPDVEVTAADIARYGEVIPRYYELIDGYLGELLALCGDDTTVLIVSDHGFGASGNLPWSGGHGRLTPGAPIAPKGVLLLSGPGVVEGPLTLDRAHVLDVVPTILRLCGLPEAEDLLGRTLEPALVAEFRSGDSGPEPVATYEEIGRIRRPTPPPVDPQGDADRLERLRALGYIQ